MIKKFEVSTEILRKVISEAMSKGGDYADLFFEHKTTNGIALEDGKVNKAFSNVDFGVGIRVLKGNQTGFAYAETVNLEAMLKASTLAASIANNKNRYKVKDIQKITPSSFYPVAQKWEDITVKDKEPFIQRLNETIFSLDEKVKKVNAFMNDESSYVLFFNSEGILTWDYRPMISMGAVCIMQKKKQKETMFKKKNLSGKKRCSK